MKRREILILLTAAALAVLVSTALYWNVKIKFNPQQIGIVTLRGHYRGYFMSFSDGLVADGKGKLRYGLVNDDGSFDRMGLRWWPKFYTLSMTNWHKDMYAE